MGSYFDAIMKGPLLGPIVSGIKKNNKISELKDLRARGDLSTDEFSTMKNLVMYGSGESVEFEYFKRGTFSSLESSLKDYWEEKTDPKDYFAERHTSYDSGIRFSKKLSRSSQSVNYSKKPQWQQKPTVKKPKPTTEQYWGFKVTKDFMNSIKNIDKNLQGRILQAITQITLSPITVMGNTIKPLTGDLEGFWRYRIGDYRLIYKPVGKFQEILLISFSSRSSAY